MLIAFISDIHANFTALVAAIARAHRSGAERILMAGDVVGGGPHPVEVIRLLKSEGIAGVRGCLTYLEWLGRAFGNAGDGSRKQALRAGMEAIRSYESGLARQLRDGLSDVKGLCIRGILDDARMSARVPTFSFTLAGHHPKAVCEALDAAGIAAWDGHYYAVEVTRRLGLDSAGGMVRVGAAHYNTSAEVRKLIAVIDGTAREAGVGPRSP